MSWLDLQPIPSCECKKCDCGLALKLSNNRDEEIFHQFMIGVDNDAYGIVRTNLLSQQPLSDLNRAYQMLVQEEHSRALPRSSQIHEACMPLPCKLNAVRGASIGSTSPSLFVLTASKKVMR